MRLVLLLIGCTAITDFNQFSAGDLSVPAGPRQFGESCDRNQSQPCVSGGTRMLQCLDMLGGKSVSGNICTRDCVMGPAACTDYPNATCVQIGGPLMSFCMPNCNASNPCRSGLTCCSGVCLPGC